MDIDSETLELQKRLYYEEKVLQNRAFGGSNYRPVNIEPFASERERIACNFTDEDRKLRKQWLEDQKLSPREVEMAKPFEKKNIFRRLASAPFDGIAKLTQPIFKENNPYLRKLLPKFFAAYAVSFYIFYRIEYAPRVWYDQKRGLVGYHSMPKDVPPGHPDFGKNVDFDISNFDQGFSKRTSHLDKNLVTSSCN